MVYKEVLKRIDEIRLDRSRGASELAREALLTLKFSVEMCEEEKTSDLIRFINEVGILLFNARPSMSPIRNLIAKALFEVNKGLEMGLKSPSSLREFASSKIEELIRCSELSLHKISKKGAEIIEEGDVVVTCSYSSTLLMTFEAARIVGKRFRILIAESRSLGRSYGKLLAEKLEERKIKVEVFPDDEIEAYVARAKKAMVGADSILEDGSVINGFPTYRLAKASKELNVPFYVLCEVSKFRVPEEELKIEEGLDFIPSEFITAILTEEGLIMPSEAVKVVRRMERYLKFVESMMKVPP